MSWYAFSVKTGREDNVKNYITGNYPHTKCLVPKRAVTEKKGGIKYVTTKLLYPGYILLYVEKKMDFMQYYQLLEVPHLLSMLNYSTRCLEEEKKEIKRELSRDYCRRLLTDEELQSGFFKEVDEGEISLITALIDQNQVINCSTLIAAEGGYLVVDGPLKNNEHLIAKVDKHKGKAKIQLSLLNEESYCNIDIKVLYEANSGSEGEREWSASGTGGGLHM